MLKTVDLHKSFGDLEVLKGIDQHIKQGEKVVVIGPSGSGKSTFLRCLNLLEVPTEGEILIEGESITAIGEGLQPKEGDEVIDAEGKYVLPGGVDQKQM